jgi:hypothetical protein
MKAKMRRMLVDLSEAATQIRRYFHSGFMRVPRAQNRILFS